MKLKLASAMAANALEAVEDLIQPIYGRPGMRMLAVVELAHVERTQPAPDEDKEASVTVGVKHLEVARGDQAEALRKAMRALYVQRTARGTLDEQLDELQLSKDTLTGVGDDLALKETARLRAAMQLHADTLQRLRIGSFTEKDLRKQLDKLHNLVTTTLQWTGDE